MHMTRNIVCLGLMALAMLADGRAAEPYGVIYETNVPMKTRDGVTLRADIYRPKADGKFPVLLERTPYDKYSNVDSGIKVAQRGFVCILQDCRAGTLRRVNRIRSNTSLRTVTMPSNGPRPCRTPTVRWG